MASCYSPLQATLHTATLLRLRQHHLDTEALPPYSPYTAPPAIYHISASSSPPAYTTTTTAPATTTLTLTPTSTSSLSAPAHHPHPGYTLQIQTSKNSGRLFRKPPSLKVYRGSGEWEGDELARVEYHKGGGMEIFFSDGYGGEGGRLMAMERTGWREEAYSFLSGSGVRWWKGGGEVRRGKEAKGRRGAGLEGGARQESGVERVLSRESGMERVASQESMASQASMDSVESGVSGVGNGGVGGRWGSVVGKAKRRDGEGEMVLVDGYGERYAVLEMAEGGGRFEVLKEGFEGELLDEIVVSGVAWGVRRGLGGTRYRRKERRSGRGDDYLLEV